ELQNEGGRLEWVTDHGIGISFPLETSDEVLARIPECLRFVVWMNLENTGISDTGLQQLERARGLESLRLVNTKISTGWIEALLLRHPTIVDITISGNLLTRSQLEHLQSQFPNVLIKEISK